MRILILNWRDIKNPQSGGAETLTYEMAKRWVKWGHQVTQFSAAFPGGKSEEVIDGVKIIRRGSPDVRSLSVSVHLVAFWFYQKYFKGKFDVVINEIHGLPFFTPLYVKEKKVVLICEVAREIWDHVFSFPWNWIGRLIEKFYFKIYKKTPFLTISSSIKKDLLRSGIAKDQIKILPMGVSLVPLPDNIKKEEVPTLIFIGRLSQMKGINDGIKAFRLVQKRFPQAHVLIHPSVREGWGLVVIEANAMNTPAVVYNVPGLRDSTKNGVTGLICVQNTPENLAKNVIKLLKDKSLYKTLQRNAHQWSKNFTWDKTAKECLRFLKG